MRRTLDQHWCDNEGGGGGIQHLVWRVSSEHAAQHWSIDEDTSSPSQTKIIHPSK
jgi:hypothetical protein